MLLRRWYAVLLHRLGSQVSSDVSDAPADFTPRAIVRLEGLFQWKTPTTQLEIEPATFRLVAQSINLLRHCVPPF